MRGPVPNARYIYLYPLILSIHVKLPVAWSMENLKNVGETINIGQEKVRKTY